MNLDNTPDRMWSYWRDKYSIATALEDYYPNTVAADPQLQVALAQLRNSELVINMIMTRREQQDEENQP